MKLTFFSLILLLIAIILILDQSVVEGKKKKNGKGGDKYSIKGKDYNKEYKEKTRKIRDVNEEYYTKNYKKKNEKQYNLKQDNNRKEIKNDKDKKIYLDKKKNKKEHVEAVKKNYLNKSEKQLKKSKETSEYKKGNKKQTLPVEDTKLEEPIEEKELVDDNDLDVIHVDQQEEQALNDTIITPEIEDKEKSNEIVEETICHCNKKIDKVEHNKTEKNENYKFETNTKVYEEKIISDKKEDNFDIKPKTKCEL